MLTWQTIVVVFVVGLCFIVFGLAALAVVDSHVTDTDTDEVTLEDLLAHGELCAYARRCGEDAEQVTAAMLRLEARRGPGRHRLPTGEYTAVPLPLAEVA